MFLDREEAGNLLAKRLSAYQDDHNAIILALPRGGVPVALVISRQLHLRMDVLITRKLPAPENPEYAMGAVAETGYVYLNEDALSSEGSYGEFLETFLEQEVYRQKEEITRRQQLYRQGNTLPPLKGKTVLLVDDGVATGSTYLASLHALHEMDVGKVIAAIPVGPTDTLRRIEPMVSELVVLEEPENFQAVGQHYQDFGQVEDDEVCRRLSEARDNVGGTESLTKS